MAKIQYKLGAIRIAFVTVLLGCAPVLAAGQEHRSTVQEEIARHEASLADARAGSRMKEVAVELNFLGSLYRQAGRPEKALEDYNQALTIEHDAGNRGAEALTKTNMARVYVDLGQEQTAFDLLIPALAAWREMGNRRGEALALDYMGMAYSNLAQEDKALEFLNQALGIFRETGARAGEANTLDNMGKVYCDMSQGTKALEYLHQALPIWREVGERSGEALTLNNIGRTYADMGEEQKSLEAFTQALELWRTQGHRMGEASTLNNMGRTYKELGQPDKALEYYERALPLWREVGNRNGEALALNDTGRVYGDMGQLKKALDYYAQALVLWRAVGNRRGEATTLNNVGRAWFAMGELRKALETDEEALLVWREVKETRGEALALISINWVFFKQGQPDKALPNALAALSLTKAAGDPDLTGAIETALMMEFRSQHRPQEAIFFGKDAVNSYQQIRRNISGLNKDLQAGFVQSKSMTYRNLAELLVETDQLDEAEHILDLLKEEELKEVVRGASEDAESKQQELKLSAAQQKAEDELSAPEKTAAGLTSLSAEYAALLGKDTRSPAEEARMKTLDAQIEAGNAEIAAFFEKTLYPELARNNGGKANDVLSGEESRVSGLQDTLLALGPGVMGIRLLLGEEHAYAIVVTARAQKKFELGAKPDELRVKVLEVREDLRSPASDPRKHLQELYSIVVAPLQEQLTDLEKTSTPQRQVPTLLWSLDGPLRYLPMAAMYDGKRYLAERFNNVLFTPESYRHMSDTANAGAANLHMLAMGLSKSYGGLPALPGVMPELEAVVRDPAVADSHGPLEGRLLSNEEFTLDAMKTQLGVGRRFTVVHIASHFVEQTGGGEEPYLMLGGESNGGTEGFPLTLSKMKNSAINFHGTKLLTLSACSTAKGDIAQNGLEVDSLGMIAQQKDAEAVLATLWDVNDASTSQLMSDFYARWAKNPAAGKAEALRQAQLDLLHGSVAGSDTTKTDRGFATTGKAANRSVPGYAHPYYWAPFVLTGNYQ
ncbi:MAG: tetratricopeptide repeat protein [Terracidiphilus sp.]|jgi:CHAT domain-containing protein/Tfp pilus assembly protein PilF